MNAPTAHHRILQSVNPLRRRDFCRNAAGLLLGAHLPPAMALTLAQTASPSPFNALRPDVATIDHDRILAAADTALRQPPPALTSLRAPQSPGAPNEYYSEAAPRDTTVPPVADAPFTAHRDALFALGLAVPALAAAWLITRERRYSDAAASYLRTWFIAPETSMLPRMQLGQVRLNSADQKDPAPTTSAPPTLEAAAPPTPARQQPAREGSFEGIIETLPLVEVVQAIPFLAASASLTPDDIKALQSWFSAYLAWLLSEQVSGPRLPQLARDSKDHNATSWLLQVAAYTLFTLPESASPRNEDQKMSDLRHRFRSVTVRSQISPDGNFPHEIGTANPYRNSLFNLDMMACVCMLLSTRFESLWDFQLQDGPGMRAAIAFHYPYILYKARWPYRADSKDFSELPSRRVSLLFCAKPYQNPDYVALWKTLPPDPKSADILRSIPVHQPLLWVTAPPRVLD